jgi:HEAT repeat protein
MNRMQLQALVWSLGIVLVVVGGGCSRIMPTPKKEIQVPDGGPPVLTSAERAERRVKPTDTTSALHGGVAPVAFEQPVEEPQLFKPLEQWTEQEAAADALGRIGAAAVPELVKALSSADPAAREKAVQVLGRMGPEAATAVPHLIGLLNDPDVSVRKATARTLGQIGPAAKDAVPALIQTLLEPVPKTALH